MALKTGLKTGEDLTKLLADFDPSRIADAFTRTMDAYRLPGANVDEILEIQRKNVEALRRVNQAAVEGVQRLAERQNAALLNAMNEAERAATHKVTAEQAKITKDAFEKALTNMRELADLVAASNEKSAEAINIRISESLDEIKTLAEAIREKAGTSTSGDDHPIELPGIEIETEEKFGFQIYRAVRHPDRVIRQLEKGMDPDDLNKLRAFGLEDAEIDALIIPRRTLSHRIAKEQKLTQDETDKVLRVARVLAQALETFNDRDKAWTWMRRSLDVFGGKRPIDLIRTDAGARLVENRLARIAWGMAA